MKFWATVLIGYIMVLTALPSVRAIRITYGHCPMQMQNKTSDNQDAEGCQKGKFIMTLNFSPVHYVGQTPDWAVGSIPLFFSHKKALLTYHKVLIDQYNHQIWQPPKIYS